MPANVSQWVTLKDFRPGIKARANPGDVARAEVLGVADKEGTYRCQAMPDGSLGPMPGLTNTINPNRPASHDNVFHNAFAISGFWIVGSIDLGSNEFHLAWQWRDESPPGSLHYHWRWIRMWDSGAGDVLLGRDGDLHPIAAFVDSIAANAAWFSGFRSHPTNDKASGLPQVAIAWFANDPNLSVWAFWPDSANPGAWPPKLLGVPYWPSLAVAHQGKHVIFDHRPDPHGPDHAWNHNEDIYFTKTNLQQVFNPGEPVQFGMNNVTGYVGACSTSHNELLLLKSGGGGLLLRGALEFPVVLSLPGLPYCGDTHHQPAATPIGAVFMTQSGGAYLWSGGENVEAISLEALDPKDLSTPGQTRDHEVSGHGRIWYWYDWVIFPNNWAWNWRQQSWWRMDNLDVVRFFWCGPDSHVHEAKFYVTPAQVKSASDPAIFEYDYNVPAKNWQWSGLPHALFEDRQFKVREAVFVVSGACDWTFDFYNLDGTYERHQFSTTRTNRPEYIRRNTNVTCQELKLVINSNSTTAAGVVHEVRIGVQTPDTHYPHNMP